MMRTRCRGTRQAALLDGGLKERELTRENGELLWQSGPVESPRERLEALALATRQHNGPEPPSIVVTHGE